MAISIRNVLAIAGSAALLASCAAGPYDYGYGYNGYNGYGPGPYDGYPGYAYAPGYDYVAPGVGVGIGFSSVERIDGGHDHHEWHGDHHGDWRGDHDRGGHDRDGDHHH